jgi:hypothetical protein
MARTSYIFQYHGENKLHFPVSWREQVTFWCDDDDDDGFGLDQQNRLKPTICRTQFEHANNYPFGISNWFSYVIWKLKIKIKCE